MTGLSDTSLKIHGSILGSGKPFIFSPELPDSLSDQHSQRWAGIQYTVRSLATVWTVRGSNRCGGEIFRTRPHRPWGPRSLLCNEYRVSLPGVKRSGRGVDHRLTSSAEAEERVELYL